ncbi:hypothetical protein PUW24_14200 [Paenibacillus urinalis]|uniref:DUF3221 domain-containing protein n=1 Tax=Paenibacillus urinalis TaxID=521520 RepID=A0AAX3N472_9BACL|nr:MULTISPECIES: hypothetical protein [Paenibacillus]WDH83919.1 hypothetical protein PUW23_06800 [Paenibacillus urinalis]WDH95377.1 hypothetical protein PUW24_14200 [Paenibacillus urinalis]WDI03573.1 hypothetical protein PUW25_06325 [Paenibacillus urinalis]GAK40962.1 hypothetical protein TCA2_3453 [Paenibacillus sp. TCA20]
MKTKKKWLVLSGSLVLVLALGIWYVQSSDILLGWSSPSKQQEYYTGTVIEIVEENSTIDGDKVLHSIKLDTGDVLTVTKNTMFFDQTSDVKRTESDLGVIQEGVEVEAWSRQVNNHMFEAFEITAK